MNRPLSRWERDPSVKKAVRANPLNGNPLRNRDDLAKAVIDLTRPLWPHLSEGKARLRLGVGGVHYGSEAAEMESLIRPLWGLVPLAAGGGADPVLKYYVEALANGTDPSHPEFWGTVTQHDQRMVEMAGIALAMILAPHVFWAPLSDEARARAADWLRMINAFPPADNNWLFFRILVNLALRNVGEDWSEELTRAALDRIDAFHVGDGYYRDGKWYQHDYYTPMGMHFYGLLLARVAPDLFPDQARRFRERARAFAPDFEHWFADDGAAIPFGRSMTYRFAQSAFWAACAFAGEEVLPWGRIKGLLLRNLRWWSGQPIADRDGVLSIGYSYPNLFVSESYNAPGSPYWALKSFLVLALDEDHPFWGAEEDDPAALARGRVAAPRAGFIMRRGKGDAVALTGGQDGREHRCCDAKYGRFAYSSAFAFSVVSDSWGPDRPERSAVDCGLMVSRDGIAWMSRGRITEGGMDHGMAWGRWTPDENLAIDSWIDFANENWHVRVHRIVTHAPLSIAEGGFCADRSGDGHVSPPEWQTVSPGRAFVRTLSSVSGIVDLGGVREGSVVRAAPNTNLRFPRTFFPKLDHQVPSGTTWLFTGVFAVADPDAPVVPIVLPGTVDELCRAHGIKPPLLNGIRPLPTPHPGKQCDTIKH